MSNDSPKQSSLAVARLPSRTDTRCDSERKERAAQFTIIHTHLMGRLGIQKLIGAFGYEEVTICHTTQYEEGYCSSSKTHRSFVFTLENLLTDLAGWWHPENKVAFLWVAHDGSMNLASFWDRGFTHLEWTSGKFGFGSHAPNNVTRGRELVEKALVDYLQP